MRRGEFYLCSSWLACSFPCTVARVDGAVIGELDVDGVAAVKHHHHLPLRANHVAHGAVVRVVWCVGEDIIEAHLTTALDSLEHPVGLGYLGLHLRVEGERAIEGEGEMSACGDGDGGGEVS